MNAPYDAIAEWYDRYLEEKPIYGEMILPALLDLTFALSGSRIVDVACGQGFVARALAERGAVVTGVDISSRLLQLACHYEVEQPLGIRYVLDDAQTLASLPDGAFDGATCSMALMTFPDLSAAFRAVHRVLRPGAWFAFTITHPCFQTSRSRWIESEGRTLREVGAYFEEGFWESDNPDSVRGQVGEAHRTLSTYLNTLIAAGFRLERIAEPQAGPRQAVHTPGNLEVPSILAVRASTL